MVYVFKTVLFAESKLKNNPTMDLCKLEDVYFQNLFKSKNLLSKLPKFFPKKRLKGLHSLQDVGTKQPCWKTGGLREVANVTLSCLIWVCVYLYVYVSVCIYISMW